MNQQVESPRKLYRSRKERVIAGVCGSLAEYFMIDPTWIRIIFILLLLPGGATILILFDPVVNCAPRTTNEAKHCYLK